MSLLDELNEMCPVAEDADLGNKLDQIITLLNEIKSDYNAHIADDTVHSSADTTNTVDSADVDTL